MKDIKDTMNKLDGIKIEKDQGGITLSCEGHRDRVWVTPNGVIYRLDSIGIPSEITNTDGRKYPGLRVFNERLRVSRHVLVWVLFNLDLARKLDTPWETEEKLEIHHIDCDVDNYKLDNLVCLSSELHKVVHNLMRQGKMHEAHEVIQVNQECQAAILADWYSEQLPEIKEQKEEN